MTSLSEIREGRIQRLVEWAARFKPTYTMLYDKLLERARLIWPYLTRATHVSYSQAALKIIRDSYSQDLRVV